MLIKHCNDAGVQVKSSALASISPEEKTTVLSYLENQGPAAASSDDAAPLAPKRELAGTSVSGKVRAIKAMAPHAQVPLRRRRKKAESTEAGGVAVADAPGVQAELGGTDVGSTTHDSMSSQELVAPGDAADTLVDVAEAAQTEKTEESTSPITREDYVPTGGSTASS